MPADPSKSALERYDAKAVDRLFSLVRWFDARGLSRLLFYGAAIPMVPPHWLLAKVLNRTHVRGKERLPPRGAGFFLLSNHTSMIDGQVLTMVTLPRAYWYPSKAEFYGSTVRGLAYLAATAFRSFPVRRGQRDTRAIEFIEALLRRGENVLLFPEGTRSTDGRLGPGKRGVGKIVHDVRPIVVPAYLEGFQQIVRRGKLLPGFGHRADICFGEPLDLDDLYSQPEGLETSQAIADRVMNAIAALRDELHAADGEP